MSRPLARWLLAALILPAIVSWVAAEEPPKTAKPAEKQSIATESPFVRLLRDDDQMPVALQTSIIRYVKPKTDAAEFHVDLVGAVHVGEKSYYERLNKEFDKYDVVLYELVAPEGTKVPKGGGGRSGHPVGAVQDGLKDLLGLEHQLALVDYHKKNFVHADMSPEKFAASMEQKKEGMWQMMWRAMGYSMARQNARDPGGLQSFALLGAMMSRDGQTMKREMAKQFEDVENMTGMFEGPEGSTILSERNKVALEVLQKQIAAGKKKLAVFYGAAHLPDMDARLHKEFGLERKNVEWLTAWDLREKPAGVKGK
jgi:hypothetical protein